jgi:hypothetical protein
MRSVEQVQLKEMTDRPHLVGSYRNHGVRGRYVPDGGGHRAGQSTAHAGRHASRAASPIADISIISYGMALKKVRGQMPGSEISWPESRKLGVQCSILVVIAGIVSWLIVA